MYKDEMDYAIDHENGVCDSTCDYCNSVDLIKFLANHNLTAKYQGNQILTQNEYTKDGKFYSEPILLPADFKKIREWLGY